MIICIVPCHLSPSTIYSTVHSLLILLKSFALYTLFNRKKVMPLRRPSGVKIKIIFALKSLFAAAANVANI